MSKAESADLIMKLYDLRREDTMREARKWFISFFPESTQDVMQTMVDERTSAYYRMVTSFWDMASSFVLNEAIDEKMFFDSGTEHIFVYAKVQPFLAEIRQLFGEPDYLINLEQLVEKIPNVEAKLESRKRLIKIWTKENRELSATENG